MSIADIKKTARETAFAARKIAFAAGQGQAAQILADFLATHRNRPLAGYRPMRTEIDPTEAMIGHAGAVCVPVIMGKGQPLRFREWNAESKMIEGEYGAMIPESGVWVEPEVLIVPLVGFDKNGFRLGYGGGFYDRTLEGLRAKRPTLAIGFAFAAQELPFVPIEVTDQRLDVIITENGLFPLA